jgi:hypothetical protein
MVISFACFQGTHILIIGVRTIRVLFVRGDGTGQAEISRFPDRQREGGYVTQAGQE